MGQMGYEPTQVEVQAAKLLIEIQRELGRNIDPLLYILANSKPAVAPDREEALRKKVLARAKEWADHPRSDEAIFTAQQFAHSIRDLLGEPEETT